jgi:hypothetical protein
MRSTWDDPWLRSHDSWLCKHDSWGKTRKQLCEQDAIVIAHAIAIIRAILIVYATAMALKKNRDHMEIINDFEQKPRDYRDYA